MPPRPLLMAARTGALLLLLAAPPRPARADGPGAAGLVTDGPGPAGVGPAGVGLVALRPAPRYADAPGVLTLGAAHADAPFGPRAADAGLAPRDSTLRLPAHMPPYTRLLWGERGLVRALGLAPSSRRGELRLRRSMLGLHQKLGLVTWGVFTAQVITGQRLVSDYSDRTADLHRPLGYATFGLYLGTASLSLGAPPARRYDTGYSTVRLHRWLAVVHFSGMMAQPWLGRWVANGGADYDRRRTIHQAVGYVTYAAFTTAMGTILLGR